MYLFLIGNFYRGAFCVYVLPNWLTIVFYIV